MPKFRKKPVTVEARQLTDPETPETVANWCGGEVKGQLADASGPLRIEVKTLEGVMSAIKGDWIIKGAGGYFYIRTPEAFKAEFEVVDQKTMDEKSPTAPHVLAFAEIMEQKLSAKIEKGGRDGWLKCSPEWLFARLIGEVGEVAALMADKHNWCHEHKLAFKIAIAYELADVANFCMMLSDRIKQDEEDADGQ